MKSSCTDHRDLIGGIIGVPNHDIVGDVDEGSPNHTVDDATCVSALSFGGSQEPIDQRQPPMRTSQGAATTRRLHPFPWSTSNDESEVFPDNLPTVKQEDEKATNDGDRPLRRSSLVANDSSLDASWFAARRLMSTDSFKRYHEEMAQNVAQEAAAAAAKKNPLHRSRRASVGTERDLHNERWSNFSSPEMRRSSRGYHPKTMHRAQKSLSLDDGLDSSMWTCRSNLSSSDRNEHSEGAKMHMGESLDTRDHLCMPVLGREQSSGAVVCETEDIVRSLECNDSISSNSAEDQNPTTDMPSFNRLHSSGTAGAVVCETDDFVRMDTPLDTRDHLCMRILGTEKSSASSIRAEFKSSPAQSRMLSDAAVVEECNDSISSNSSDDQNPTIGMPSFNRLTSSGTAGAVVCETDDFVRTMRDFDDEVQKQRQRINSNLSGSTMSQTRCTSPPRRHCRQASHEASSSTLLSADMIDLDGPPLKQDCGDLLAEGIEHLSMAMLVSIYGKLREMSLLGHVSVKLRDIDVNSHQYNSRKNEMKRLGEWTAADEAKGYLDSTRNAGFIVRCVMDEAELFEAEHARGAGNEFSHALLEYDASLLKDFKTWVEESKVKQLDVATECIIKKIREECSQRQIARKEMSSSNHSMLSSQRPCLARRRGSLMDVSKSFEGASWLKQERKLIEEHFGVKNGLPASRTTSLSRYRLPGELSGSFIKRAIDESSDAFFEEGSVMRNLLESGFEVVWFADRHPSDIIYGICVNRQTATVTVVFRGQEGIFDLCCDTAMSSFPNPIAHEDYEGNSEYIKLRSIVADELLRVRMDTKMSLISEIREKIVIIGQELTSGAGYHLSVVGHSRGGGYATVLGYYLASDMHLELASAVRVFTFSSSLVGCADFKKGFKHLEEEGRLVHARFANSNDLFTSLPLRGYCEENNSKVKCHHVGMQVRLHKANDAGRRRIKQSLDVSYGVDDVPFLIGVAQAAKNMLSFIKSLVCFVCTKNCSISQYHLRMHFAREYRLALGDGVLRFDRKRKTLKTLNEYYMMKCRRVHQYIIGPKETLTMLTWAVFLLVVSLLYVQIDIFLKFGL